MPTKNKPTTKRDNPEQSARFIETGKTLGADKDEGALDRVFKKIAPEKRRPTK